MSPPSNSSCPWLIIQPLRIKGPPPPAPPVPRAIDPPLPIATPGLEDSCTLLQRMGDLGSVPSHDTGYVELLLDDHQTQPHIPADRTPSL